MSQPKVSFIFIHGFCFGPSLWSDMLPFFRGYSDQLVNYSLYTSSHLNGFSVDQTMQELCAIIQQYPDRKWILVGHSLGGYLSLEMIHRHRELISGCILINSHLRNDTKKKQKIRDKQISLIKKRGLSAYLRVFYHNMDPSRAVEWQQRFGKQLNVQAVLDQLVYMRDREVFFTSIEEFTKDGFLGWIHADKDILIETDDVFDKFSKLNKGYVSVIGGGHLSPLNNSQACLERIKTMWNYLSFLF